MAALLWRAQSPLEGNRASVGPPRTRSAGDGGSNHSGRCFGSHHRLVGFRDDDSTDVALGDVWTLLRRGSDLLRDRCVDHRDGGNQASVSPGRLSSGDSL